MTNRRIKVEGERKDDTKLGQDLSLIFWLQAKRVLRERREREEKERAKRKARMEGGSHE
jgi:hypothetical protein